MDRKNYLCILLVSFFSAFLWADIPVIKSAKSGAVYYQTLEWESSGYVKFYRVVVEQKSEHGYEQVCSVDTKENSYDVSLDIGSYRFKVDFHNVLGQVAFVTDYKYFDILEAYQPKLSLDSKASIGTNKKEFDGVFVLNAENLNRQAVFYLEGKTKSGDKIKIDPVHVSVVGTQVQVKFPVETIPAGKYRVVAQNPGGLTASSKTIKINCGDAEEGEVFLAFAYSPKIFVNDDFIEKLFGTNVPLAGYNLQASYLHPVTGDLKIGGGLIFRHLYLSNEDSIRKATAHLLSADGNFIVECKLHSFKESELLADFYCGLGVESINALKVVAKDGSESLNLNSYLYNYDVGVQGKLFFNDRYCLLSGLEFESQIKSGKADYKFSSVNFHLGAGVRF